MFLVTLGLDAQPCGGYKPAPLSLNTGCTPLQPCTLETTLTLRVGYPFGCPNPTYPFACDPIFTILPNDVVNWNFGDGSTASRTGTGFIQHTYASGGAYDVTVSVTNCSGSSSIMSKAMIARSNTTRVFFPQETMAVSEGVGFVHIPLTRIGDTSISSSVLFSTSVPGYLPPGYPAFWGRLPGIALPVNFAPGETTHIVDLPVQNDDVWTGDYFVYIYVTSLDGTLVGTLDDQQRITHAQTIVQTVDDDPLPIVSIGDATVSESAGMASFPITLDRPTGVFLSFSCEMTGITATPLIDYDPTRIAAEIREGHDSTTCSVPIIDDGAIEHDEKFRVVLKAFSQSAMMGRTEAIGTILNDDFALTPDRSELAIGESTTLTLDAGEAFTTPTTISLEISDA